MTKKLMSVFELQTKVEATGSKFFSKNTLRFAGDSVGNFGVSATPVKINTKAGPGLVWELYRRRPVKHAVQTSAYFCVWTFQQLVPVVHNSFTAPTESEK